MIQFASLQGNGRIVYFYLDYRFLSTLGIKMYLSIHIRVSRMVKKEVEMFDVRRAEEFKAGVVTYLEAMLRAQVSKVCFVAKASLPVNVVVLPKL